MTSGYDPTKGEVIPQAPDVGDIVEFVEETLFMTEEEKKSIGWPILPGDRGTVTERLDMANGWPVNVVFERDQVKRTMFQSMIRRVAE